MRNGCNSFTSTACCAGAFAPPLGSLNCARIYVIENEWSTMQRPTFTALGAFYRRLSARVGKAKAVTATARKLAVLFYRALRFGLAYVDRGSAHYEERYKSRAIHHLKRRARSLGFTLIEKAETAEGVS